MCEFGHTAVRFGTNGLVKKPRKPTAWMRYSEAKITNLSKKNRLLPPKQLCLLGAIPISGIGFHTIVSNKA